MLFPKARYSVRSLFGTEMSYCFVLVLLFGFHRVGLLDSIAGSCSIGGIRNGVVWIQFGYFVRCWREVELYVLNDRSNMLIEENKQIGLDEAAKNLPHEMDQLSRGYSEDTWIQELRYRSSVAMHSLGVDETYGVLETIETTTMGS